jgi:hypothetical protein
MVCGRPTATNIGVPEFEAFVLRTIHTRLGPADSADGELATASDVMMAHPLALQLRNLQTLVEVAVDKNSTVVFPAPLMSTIAELGAFLERESKAAGELPAAPAPPTGSANGEPVPHDRHQPARPVASARDNP